VSDHLTRKELKTDQVAVTVGQGVHYFTAHKQQVTRIAAIVVAVAVVAGGFYWYRSAQSTARQTALAEAFAAESTPVSVQQAGGPATFPTDQAKKEAVVKAFSKVQTEYAGSDEAYIAEYYMAGQDVDDAKMDSAKKRYQDVADHAGKNYSSLAKLALAQILFAENKNAEAEKILRDLIENPTDLVSKDQASITLAHGIIATKPEEAKKLLTPIASQTESKDAPIAATLMSEANVKK